MNSLSWKVSSTEGIILDYGDMRAGFKFRGNNDIDEAIYSSSNGTRYYTRQSSDGRAAREDKALDPVGVFNGVSPLGGTVRYRLDSDGTYTCFIQGGVRDEVTNGTWKLSGDSVSLNDRGATYAMRVTSRGLMSGSYLFKRAGIELSGGNVEEPSSQNAQVTQEPSATEANAKVAAQEDKASISEEERNRQIDKAVLRNARMLSAAADHYYLENGVSTVASVNLIGPTMEIKSLGTVANEVYPSGFTLGTTITVSNVAGVRTITYSP